METHVNLHPSDKPARKSKKFAGALLYVAGMFGAISLCGYWSLPIDSGGLTMLFGGLGLVCGAQVGGQSLVDREHAKPGGKGSS